MNGGDAPDWQTQKEEIHCPMCEYNLCGLSTPRCPECGYQFAWKDLLDARTRPHRYLFEHHPEANFKSFWKTAWGGLRPGKFWSELHAGQKSRPGRLFIYWIVVCAISLGPLIASVLTAGIMLTLEAQQARIGLQQNPSVANSPRFAFFVDQFHPHLWNAVYYRRLWRLRPDFPVMLVMIAILIAWPWMTFLLLMIFRRSMRKGKVGAIHALRAVIYSFDFSLWVGGVLGIMLPILMMISAPPLVLSFNQWRNWAPFNSPGKPPSPYYSQLSNFFVGHTETWMMSWAHGILGVFVVVGVYRLSVAYRKYLKFEHALTTVLSTQIILLLSIAIIAVNWDSQLESYWRMVLPKKS